MQNLSRLDRLLAAVQRAVQTVGGRSIASRPYPPLAAAETPQAPLSESDRRHAAALIRVDHVGEVCAQALYEAQALGARQEPVRVALERASREEIDHLAWTRKRLAELDDRASLLNPLWYAGAFAIGLVASRLGDRVSLGFVVETERQVEQHLLGHLERLPAQDHASRAIVAQMREDERRHGLAASDLGGIDLPAPARLAMRMAARVMTATSYYV
ncbi:MAG TPA: 2-polyprenyl-3-methyl-6-methoxy-1,4-benzoquinone monooxygenase [Burkholderiaceae bacterium]|jgi:ubiquinone biosynthesis monooxygenase Coq7|nr:2-polyprenyl-3-methyl-6-methoxy-1,4-benzoquinone monooxygenase [Burkholderiaceae bacterium]